MISSLRFWLTALCAGLIVTALAGVDSARGQTVLIDALEGGSEAGSGVDFDGAFAQSFTTGSQTGGYRLGSIEIELFDAFVRTSLRMTVRANSSGLPGNVLHTLNEPSTYPTKGGVVKFTAGSGGFTLAAGTTYYVHVQRHPNGSSASILRASGFKPTFAMGWSFPRKLQHKPNGQTNYQTYSTDYLRMALNELLDPGKPAISGTATAGQTLTASSGNINDEDGVSGVTYSYQWLRAEGDESDENEISGATSSTYTLTDHDVNKKIRVRASFTDEGDNAETRLSDFYPDSATVAPRSGASAGPNTATCTFGISSNQDPPTRGSVLTAASADCVDPGDGLPQEFDVSLQWQRVVPGANPVDLASQDPTLTLLVDDVGHKVQLVYSFMDSNGNAESITSAPFPDSGTIVSDNTAATGSPAIQGTARVSETLTATTGDVSDADNVDWSTFSFRWQRENAAENGWDDISGATSTATSQSSTSAYTLVEADFERRIRVRGTFLDDKGYNEETVSGATAAVSPANRQPVGEPVITGMAEVGLVLSADTSGISDPDGPSTLTFSIQWQRQSTGGAWVDIADANTASYTLETVDGGRRLRIKVSYTDDNGNGHELFSAAYPGSGATVSAPPTGLPRISDTTPTPGQTLTAVTSGISDPNGLTTPNFTFQWQRVDSDGVSNPVDIGDRATYGVVEADALKRILVTVSFTDDNGDMHTLSSVNSEIVNSPATGAPTVVGTTVEGETLTVNTAGIADANGKPTLFSYHWRRVDADGSSNPVDIGTDSETYVPVLADAGKRIRVEVRFTDSDGYSESRTSEATRFVSPANNNAATGEPAISGTAKVEEVLTATAGTIDDIDGLSMVTYLYQWQREDAAAASGWADIAGANTATYTLATADRFKRVRVTFTFMDDLSSFEERVSAPYPAAAETVDPIDNIAASGAPTISGAAKVDETMEADPSAITDANGLSGVSFSLQWQRGEDSATPGWTDIADATAATYTAVKEDEGMKLRVVASFVDDDRYMESRESEAYPSSGTVVRRDNTPASGVPTVSGTAKVGEALTADATDIADSNGLGTIEYAWLRADGMEQADIDSAATISGATSITYTLIKADEAKHVLAQVSFTDADGYTETLTSAPTTSILRRDNVDVAGEVTISGVTKVGQRLTADTTGISDANGVSGVTFTYQWQRIDSDDGSSPVDLVSGGNSYIPVAGDIGKRLRVIVSFADVDGYEESLTSGYTVRISSASNNFATGRPVIHGAALVGQILSANAGSTADTDGLVAPVAYQYRWQRMVVGGEWQTIAEARSIRYQLAEADLEMKVRVVLLFTDNLGNPEERISNAFPSGAATVQSAEAGTASAAVERTFSITAPTAVAVEGNPGQTTAMVFTVTLAPAATQAVSVDFESAGGTATLGRDYTLPSTNRLTFSPGDTSLTVTARVLGDFLREKVETVTLSLSNPSEGVTLRRARATGRIANRANAPAVVSVANAVVDEGRREEETEVRFSLQVTTALDYAVTVQYQVAFNEDTVSGALARSVGARACSDSPATGSVTIARGDTAADVIERIGADCRPEGDLEIRVSGIQAPGQSAEAIPDLLFMHQTVDGALIASNIPASPSSEDWATTSALASFGRSVAIDVVEAIWSRAEAHRYGNLSSYTSVGGRSIDASALSGNATTGQVTREIARLFGIEAVAPESAPSNWMRSDTPAGGGIDDYMNWAGLPDGKSLTGNSSFNLALDDEEEEGNSVVFWGTGSLASFESELEDSRFSKLNSDGSTVAVSLGFDYWLGKRLLMGVAVSHSSGKSEYRFADTNDGSGEIEPTLTSATPWLRWKSISGTEMWAAAGIGTGKAAATHTGGSVEMDIDAQIAAIGVWDQIANYRGAVIAAKADAVTATVSSEGAGEFVDGVDSDSRRIRLAAELSSEMLLSYDQRVAYALELGARSDSGEAESGSGVDFAAEVDYADIWSGLKIKGMGSMIVSHSQEGFEEMGLGLEASYDLGNDARGFQVSLMPTWNAPRTSVASAMWEAKSSSLSPTSSAAAGIQARLGYGMDAMRDGALATVYSDFLSEEAESRLRLGGSLEGQDALLNRFSLGAYGEVRTRRDRVERSIMVEGSLGF